MTKTGAQGSRLAQQYLADLERALAGAEPREREETLAAVRERIDDAPDGDDAAVQSVLDELGPVEAIAAAATPALTQERSNVSRYVALACAALALLGIVVLPFLAIPVAVVTLILGIVQVRRRGPGRGIAVSTIVVASVALLWVATLAMLFIPVSTEISGGELTTSDPIPASTGAPTSP